MAIILIVDDEQTNREFLVTLLGYRGHRLLEAADGLEALALARAERPDLVIADILMPTMDGYEFVRQLRADPVIAQIPVIFYTAYYHEHEAQALARACGVAHILTKPSEPEAVLGTVDAALGLTAPPQPPPVQDTFDREHLRLLTDKLSQHATELQKANLQLSALIEISLQLASERDPQRLLESFCHTTRDLIGAKYAAVGIVGEDQQSLRRFFISGMDAERAVGIDTPAPQVGVLGKLLAERRSCRLQNPDGDPSAVGFPPTYPPIYSFLAAPIVSPTQVYGWLGLIDKMGAAEFSEEDQRLVAILAAQVGRIYENGRLYRGAQHYAAELEQEVAERKRAEAALYVSQERFRALLENSPDAIALFSLDGVILYGSPATTRILGYPLDEFVGRNAFELIHPDDHAFATRQFAEVIQKPATGIRIHARVRHQDGSWRFLEGVFTNLLANPSVSAIVCNYRDVSERKRLEEQFRHAQKMESIGRLAGGIAHDFNNLLTTITGYAELAMEALSPSDPIHGDVEAIQKAAERAADLTRQLLAFARKQIVEPRVLNLNTVIGDLDKILHRLLGEDIELITLPAPDLGQVKVDPGHIEQVIVNLAVNARDAMSNGGKLTVETASIVLDSDYAQQHVGVTPGAYVMLAISDTGSGMDAEVQQHLFEPFFTTKEPGKGTGLGLATCYGIVKQHGGHIGVYSEVGHGTTFKIYLPCVEEAPDEELQRGAVPAVPQGTEMVLLVEDEPLVRELASSILRRQGYTVVAASNGDEALHIAQAYAGESIDLLVTDVVLPGMGGKALADQMTGAHPGMKVLFISGYATDAVTQNGWLDPGTHFLAKPFTRMAFARKVREVLDS